ncbi:MAG: TolA-binding protein [Cellvibrionaceae bacterium]|jgi:TolA-binding protein
MLNELNFQLRESKDLVDEFREEIDSITSQLPRIIRRLEEAKFEYQELEVSVDAKDSIISEISSEMGFCKSQILALEDRREHVNKVESMRIEKEKINQRIQNLQDKLDQINAQQADRYNLVYDSIEIIAGNLLSQDGSYEPTFDEVEEVSFDFSKDKMFVNGRSKFSASSMVIMKNSIRLAIFLHAVEDKYARLPNFLIMDNIEDKGMVDERSHNFQHLIISECKKLENKYQLIFTTSMIAPDLNGSTFCVGPMYEKGMHTLEFYKK